MVRRWSVQTQEVYEAGNRGAEYSNPVLIENTLLFGSSGAGLVSMYPKINARRWALPVKNGVMSPLAVDRDSVFFGGGDGFLYSVNVDTGKVNWRYELRNPIVSQPTVSGGRVFVTTTDDTVYAFDAGTGKWLWHYRRRTSPSATILGASSPIIDNNEVITGLSDGFVVGLSVNDGQLKWERKLHQGTKFTDVDAKPVLDNSVLYIPSYDGALYALGRQNADVLWRFDAGGSRTVVVEDARLFLPSSDGRVYALQKSNGKELWRFDLDGGTPTQLVVTDRYVIVGSSFQYLYVLDKNTGKGLYRYNVGFDSGFGGAPAFDADSGRLYILSHGGNLMAFEVRKPQKKPAAVGNTDGYVF